MFVLWSDNDESCISAASHTLTHDQNDNANNFLFLYICFPVHCNSSVDVIVNAHELCRLQSSIGDNDDVVASTFFFLLIVSLFQRAWERAKACGGVDKKVSSVTHRQFAAAAAVEKCRGKLW